MATKTPGEWLTEELNERDWSQAKLARRADIDSGYLNRIISGERMAGIEACIGIATAFTLPLDLVVRWLRPDQLSQRSRSEMTLAEANFLFAQLTDAEQEMLLTQMRALARKRDAETSPATT